jgi:hypothetical protein
MGKGSGSSNTTSDSISKAYWEIKYESPLKWFEMKLP